MKYLSKIFQPLVSTPKNAVVKNLDAASKSQKLLFELGLVRPLGAAGCFALLPLLLRSRDKLCRLVSGALEGAGAQPTVLPLLAPEESWRRSGRLEDAGEELMKVGDRQGRRYILSPTHEELMTELMAELSPISPKQLPLMLYQIGPKFRDEMRPRHGIIRSREFLMKDLYTFHEDEECARRTYHLIGEVYQRIFQEIGVEYIKVEADTGVMGGSLSHEYHYPAAIGEDRLRQCTSCAYQTSPLLHDEGTKCSRCGGDHVKEIMGIEVGHTFLLGTRYSQPLGAHLVSKKPLHMGCYGLGLSRILAASLEALCSPTQLRWPPALAPYSLCIIGPKEGSKEFDVASPLVEKVYSLLQESCPRLKEDILVDDRTHMTIGKRVMEAKRMGYPHILVVGQKALAEPPQFELLDTEGDSVQLLELDALLKTRGLQELGRQTPPHCDGSMENIAQ